MKLRIAKKILRNCGGYKEWTRYSNYQFDQAFKRWQKSYMRWVISFGGINNKNYKHDTFRQGHWDPTIPEKNTIPF